MALECGVPLGFVLGPILFLLFTADLRHGQKPVLQLPYNVSEATDKKQLIIYKKQIATKG
jgi:hypothetical protein